MINIKNLTKSYQDTKVFDDFNLTIQAGKSVAIVGSSGAGKSTLLNIIGGIDKGDSGEVIICGKNLSKLKENKLTEFRAQNLGFIYQSHHLLPDFTALENVCMPLLINNIKKNTAIKSAQNILTKVGLKDKFNNLPSQLSGGQRQRVAIARAMVAKPQIILADEPTGNLDYENANAVMQLLLTMQQENNS